MATKYFRKQFYRLDELCERWGMLLADFEPFALGDELRLSVVVGGIMVEFGSWDQVDEEEWCRIPEGTKFLTGVVDLRGDHAWHILRMGRYAVDQFVVPSGKYMDISMSDVHEGILEVRREDLVLRHVEVERFEAAQGITVASGPIGRADIVALPARARGAQPTHDWDAFWIEVARTLYFEGVPSSQSALVDRLRSWFETENRKVPDDSTIKKKLKPLWQIFLPEAERRSA